MFWRRVRTVIVLTIGVLVVAGLAGGALLLLTEGSQDDDGGGDPAAAPTDWERYSVDGRSITVRYGGSACQERAEATVEETADRVVITLRTVVAAGSCSMRQVRYDEKVDLRAPLRGRPVYDGACLERLPDRQCLRPRRTTQRA